MADEQPQSGNQPPISEPASKPGESDAMIKAAVDAALADERARVAKEKDAEKTAADEKEAKQRGEFERLYNAEKADREKAIADNRKLRQSIALRDHLAEKHKDYVGSAIDIAPHIPADAEGDALSKAVEKAVADFIARNPRATPRGGVPLPSNTTVQPDRQPSRIDAMNYGSQTYRGPRPARQN